MDDSLLCPYHKALEERQKKPLAKITATPIDGPHYVTNKKTGEVAWVGSVAEEIAFWRRRSALTAEPATVTDRR